MSGYDFSIDAGDNSPNKYTPDISYDFIGIKINAPEIINLSALTDDNVSALIPICGAYQFNLAFTIKLGSPQQHMSVVVINNNDKSYNGSMQDPDTALENTQVVEIDMSNAESQLIGGYFNINVLDYVKIPIVSGEVSVYIFLGEHKSNVVKILLEDDI